MGQNTAIEWCDHTFNPWRGCTKISDGCRHCYAEKQSKRNLKLLGEWGPSGTRVVASEEKWREPQAWNRAAAKAGTRRRVFCASIADVFEDWSGKMVNAAGEELFQCCQCSHRWSADMTDHDPTKRDPRIVCQQCGSPGPNAASMSDVRDRLFDLIEATEHLDWLLLTKRPQNIQPYYERRMKRRPFVVHDPEAGPRQERWTTHHEIGISPAKMWPNVWLGTSVENQQAADERIPHLLRVPARVRFLSCEPLLGPVDLSGPLGLNDHGDLFPGSNGDPGMPGGSQIDWVIVGGESGGQARPMHPDWARSLVRQCRDAGVACFMKQLGACWAKDSGRKGKGDDLSLWPNDLRVREFPEASDATQAFD